MLSLLAALVCTSPATAQEFILNTETSAGIWVDSPQSDRFKPGFYLAVRPGVALGPVLAMQWSYSLLITPPKGAYEDTGTAHSVSAGARIRPFGTRQKPLSRVNGLFADFNLGYVRTGDLDRWGFDTGIGYNFQVTPGFALGPVVRYGQIVQPDNQSGVNPNDGQYIAAGLNFGFGQAHKPPAEPIDPVCPDAPECPVTVIEKMPVIVVEAGCPDQDGDGTCDSKDRCPTAAGPSGARGCPTDPCSGKPLVVDVHFDYDSAEMPDFKLREPQTMDPVLDAVADAIAQDPSCRVCVVGFASEEGAPEYNQDLSVHRANAVQSYMTARGLAKSRIPTMGMGARCQLVPEESRPENRRVEFRRLQEGESCQNNCSQQ